MAKIPQSELDQLKKEIDLVMLIQQKGIVVIKQGSDYKCICPFHDDKNPSLVITPSKGLWHCFPCNIGGTVIDWVMRTEKVSFRHAIEILKEKGGGISPNIKKCKGAITGLKETLSLDQEDKELIINTVLYYHERLLNHQEAKEYLKSRGIYSDEIITKFKIGFADRTLGLRMPYRQGDKGKKLRSKLQEIGILKESGHEQFRGSITIPIFNESNEIKEIYGRKICNRLRKEAPKHTYLKGKHGGIFNPDCLKTENKTIFLCESIIDSLSLYKYDFKNTTSSFGTNGLTDEMISCFLHHKIAKIYFFYDSDDAGNKASKKQAKALTNEGIQCFRITLPNNKDLNEMLNLWDDPKQEITRLINKAEQIYKSLNNDSTHTPFNSLAANSSYALDEQDLPINSQDNIKENIVTSSSDAKFNVATKEKSINTFSQCEELKQDLSLDAKKAFEQENITNEKQQAQIKVPQLEIPTTIKGEDIFISLGERTYRIRGLYKNLSFDVMRVNIRVSANDYFHIDTFDLYHARNRSSFILVASKELQIDDKTIKRDLGRVLLKLEELQEIKINETLNAKNEDKKVDISSEDQEIAIKYLKDKNLIKNILSDFNKCGVIGEENNKLVAYLACTSRQMDRPLAVIVQSSSSAGKTSLMEAVLAFMPSEEQLKYSAITGQALFYMGETNLKHKILAIIEEEGVEKATYALKLLQSEGKLSIASTGKDSQGRMQTEEYQVEGPVMIFLTTTAMDIDEELLNRCLVLSVNESREQTKKIHQLQRNSQSIEGLLKDKTKLSILQRQQNIQRLLKPIIVANPYAKHLSFLSDKTRMRRDHLKYLTLIRSIAFLHQYQRPVKTIEHEGKKVSYIEVNISDIELANKLCHEVLGRSLDELSPQTKRLLNLIYEMVQKTIAKEGLRQEDFHFTRKTVREYTGFSNSQLKTHMSRLEDLEYMMVLKSHRGQFHQYELVYKGEDQEKEKFMMGLIDIKSLKDKKKNQNDEYDAKWSGSNEPKSTPSLGEVCPKSGGGLTKLSPDLQTLVGAISPKHQKTNVYVEKFNPSNHSYIHHNDINFFPLVAKNNKPSNIEMELTP